MGADLRRGRILVDATDRIPTPSQQRFLDSRARIAAFLGGYGSGKTTTGAEAALDLAAANRGCDGFIAAPTWGTLQRTTLRAFYDPDAPDSGACPREIVREYNAGKRYLELVNGSRVYYGSADRAGSLEGQNLAWFWLDEARLARKAAWTVLLGRLRDRRAKRLQGLITSTPSVGWLQEEFGARKEGREVVHGSTRENAKNLAPGFLEDLERTYSVREARVLIDGEFGLLVGAVLEEFDRRHHLVDWKYDPRLRTILCVDFGYRRPYAGWAQVLPEGWDVPGHGRAGPEGAYVAFDELVPENITTELLGAAIAAKRYRIDVVYCDPAGDAVQAATGLNDVKALKGALGTEAVRWVTEPRWRHIPTGIALLRGLLKNARGVTRLWVSRSLDKPRELRGLVKDFEGYAYPEATHGRPVGDVPLKDGLHDHGVDGWRYFAVNEALGRRQSLPAGIPAM